MKGEPLKQSQITAVLAATIASGASGHRLQPTPESLLAFELSDVTHHSQQCFLQCLHRFILPPAGDHEKETVQPVKVDPMEFAKRFFISSANLCREPGDIHSRLHHAILSQTWVGIQ